MERCTIVVHCLQLCSFICKDFCAKLTGTAVATPRGGGIISKKFTVMSGGSIPSIEVNLRTIKRVNPTMTEIRSALSVMLVYTVKMSADHSPIFYISAQSACNPIFKKEKKKTTLKYTKECVLVDVNKYSWADSS